MSGILCAGDVYMDRFDAAGVSTGLILLADAKQFEINEPSEDKDRILRGRDTYGQLGDSVKVKKPAELKIKIDEISAAALGLALLGTVTAPTQASGTVTDAAYVLKRDIWVPLVHQYINATGFSVAHTTGTPVYTEGTDYKVNRQLGLVLALSTGAITDGQSVKISYGRAAATGSIIAGGAQPIVKARFLLDGKNLANQRDIVVDVDEATISPGEAVDFASENYVSVTLNGKMRTLPGKTAPYTVQYR